MEVPITCNELSTTGLFATIMIVNFLLWPSTASVTCVTIVHEQQGLPQLTCQDLCK